MEKTLRDLESWNESCENWEKQTHIDLAVAYNARIDTVKGLDSGIKALQSSFANLQTTIGNPRSDISNIGSRTSLAEHRLNGFSTT